MSMLPNYQRRITFSIVFISAIFLMIVSFLVYSSFIYYSSCDDEACFFTHLKHCDRAVYTRGGDFSVFYSVEGYKFNKCQVKVSINDPENLVGLRKIYIGTKMICNLPIGYDNYPENNLESCSGMLKEGLQEVLIDRLKVEIARNVGEINVNVLGTG